MLPTSCVHFESIQPARIIVARHLRCGPNHSSVILHHSDLLFFFLIRQEPAKLHQLSGCLRPANQRLVALLGRTSGGASRPVPELLHMSDHKHRQKTLCILAHVVTGEQDLRRSCAAFTYPTANKSCCCPARSENLLRNQPGFT